MNRYTLPDLPWEPDALEPHCSGHVIEIHHAKHHAAYVKGANQALEKLAEARERKAFDALGGLEKDLAFHVSGHVLHSLFWQNLAPESGDEPTGALADAIDRDFGSLAGLQGHMSRTATSLQGSGWAALSFEPVGKILTVQQIHDHQGNTTQGSVPLLVLDMWEHAYYLQYQTAKDDWVEAYWKIVNWADVAGRFETIRGLDLDLGTVEHAAGSARSSRRR